MTDRIEIVVFEVAGQSFALELAEVGEVARPGELHPLEEPAWPAVGTVRVGKRSMPAVDARERLGFQREERAAGRLLVVEAGEAGEVALLVDAVVEVRTAATADLHSPPPIFQGGGRTSALVRLDDDELIVLLSARRLFSEPELARLTTVRTGSAEPVTGTREDGR